MKHHGIKVSSLAFAQTKKKCGLEVGECYNLPSGHGRPPTNLTPEKEAAIRDALAYFAMIWNPQNTTDTVAEITEAVPAVENAETAVPESNHYVILWIIVAVAAAAIVVVIFVKKKK